MGALMRVVNPMFARQARAAVAMDTHDLTFDAAPGRRLFPSVPATDVKTAVERHLRSDGAIQPRDQGTAALRRNAAS
jgi:hypothetical protein